MNMMEYLKGNTDHRDNLMSLSESSIKKLCLESSERYLTSSKGIRNIKNQQHFRIGFCAVIANIKNIHFM
jgi:hypothetical protein